MLKFCYVPATRAASSKGIFVAAASGTNQTIRAVGACHKSVYLSQMSMVLMYAHKLSTINVSVIGNPPLKLVKWVRSQHQLCSAKKSRTKIYHTDCIIYCSLSLNNCQNVILWQLLSSTQIYQLKSFKGLVRSKLELLKVWAFPTLFFSFFLFFINFLTQFNIIL